MKIVKMGKTGVLTDARALLEHKGCPHCGETKRSIEYKEHWLTRGICKCVKPRIYKTGIFRRKTWQVDTYHCFTCGCKWEGEPRERN